MANAVEKLNTIAISDIEKVNTLTDDNIEDLNTLSFEGVVYVGDWHGARFVAMGGSDYGPYTGDSFYNNIQYKAATSTGDSADFGDAQEAMGYGAGFSNGTRMCAMDGET